MRISVTLLLSMVFVAILAEDATAKKLHDFQHECGLATNNFRAMLQCTENKAKQTLRYKIGGAGASVDYYFSVGYFLADEIEAGRISESEANLKLSEFYLQLQSQERMRNMQASQLFSNFLNTYNQQYQAAPQPPLPSPPRRCTSRWVGGSLITNCW